MKYNKKLIPSEIKDMQEVGDIINIIIHSYYKNIIQENGIDEYSDILIKNLNKRKNESKISIYLYNRWIEVIEDIKKGNVDILTENTEKMQELRSTSPFVEVGIPKNIREEIIDLVFEKFKKYRKKKREIK